MVGERQGYAPGFRSHDRRIVVWGNVDRLYACQMNSDEAMMGSHPSPKDD
jgi:hypothetical protein